MGAKKRNKKRDGPTGAGAAQAAMTSAAAAPPLADAETQARAAEMQLEELDVLEAIFDADLTRHSATPLFAHIFSIRMQCAAHEIVLTFDLPRSYPLVASPHIAIKLEQGLSDEGKRRLLDELEQLAQDKLGDAMIYDLVMHASDYVQTHVQDQSSFFEQMVQRQHDRESEERREEEELQQLEEREAEAAGQEIWARIDEERRKIQRKTKQRRRRHRASVDITSEDAGTTSDGDMSGSEATMDEDLPRGARKLTMGEQDDALDSASESASASGSASSDDDMQALADRAYSRYSADFKELGQLGRGGGGQVVKARNRLDRQLYAVKKIKLDPDDPAMKKKILREVKTISRMQHRHIVRYFQAWIEGDRGTSSDDEEESSEDDDDDDDEDDSPWSHGPSGDESNDDVDVAGGDAFLVDEEEDDDDWLGTLSNSVHRWSSKHSSRRRSSSAYRSLRLPSTCEEDGGFVWERDDDADAAADEQQMGARRGGAARRSEDDPDSGTTRSSRRKKQSEMLYIQMEFCEANSLREVIDQGALHTHPDKIWTWFRQILEAIAYIHRQGIIHRDIKPPNIFLDAEGAVKVGDFGLAVRPSKRGLTEEEEDPDQDASGEDATNDEDAASAAASLMRLGLSAGASAAEVYGRLRMENLESTRMAGAGSGPPHLPQRAAGLTSMTTASLDADDNITIGVGTTFYRAPEQERQGHGQRYNHKADMFSLGIVLFEMWSPPFTTLMERAQALTGLREHHALPASFAAPESVQQLVLWLCHPQPASRPSASELLASPLLPAKIEVEESYLREALQTLANPQGKFFGQLIDALLRQEPLSHLDYIYDHSDTLKMRTYVAELKTWSLVQTAMQRVFERHGAVLHETPLLMPRAPARPLGGISAGSNANAVAAATVVPPSACELLDGSGVSVTLPFDLTERTARFVARHGISRLKCFQFDRVFRKSATGGHPRELTEADFNIIWDGPAAGNGPSNGSVNGSAAGPATTAAASLACLELESLQVVAEVLRALLAPLGSYFVRVNDARITRGILSLCGIPSAAARDLLKLLSTEVSLRVYAGIPSRVPPTLKPGRWKFIAKQMLAHAVPQDAIDAARPFFLLPTDCHASLDLITSEAQKLLTKRLGALKAKASPSAAASAHADAPASSSRDVKRNKVESQLRRVFKELTDGIAALRRVLQDAEVLQLQGPFCLRVDIGLRPRPERFTSGFLFQAVLSLQAAAARAQQDATTALVVAEGGRFDALIERFKLPGGSSKAKAKTVAAMGVRFSVDKIVACVVSAASTALAESKPTLPLLEMAPHARHVLICSAGKAASETLTQRLQLAMQLWAHGISADYLHPEPLHLEDLEEHCAAQQIAWMVIVQPHAMREKKHVKVRCVRNPSEGDAVVASAALVEHFVERWRGGGSKTSYAQSHGLHGHGSHMDSASTRHPHPDALLSMSSSGASARDLSVSRTPLFDVSVLDGKHVAKDARIQNLQDHQKVVRRVSKWITTSFSARGEDTMKVFSVDLPFGVVRELSSALMEHGAAGVEMAVANNPRYRKQLRYTADELLQLMPTRAGRERYVLLHSLVDDRYDLMSLSMASSTSKASSSSGSRRADKNRKSP